MNTSSIRIATRASPLALWQAEHVAALLRGIAPSQRVELVHVSTSGDQDRTRPLTQTGSVGFFTREVQLAVLDGRADLAVHSLKDLPTDPVTGLTLGGVPERGPRFDVLVLPAGASLAGLAALACGARIGTGSPRRRAQLLHQRRDLVMCDVRGNVETRIRKLDAGEYDALILAEAGLQRLNFGDRISLILHPPAMYPAVGQAAIGIECRADDAQLIAMLARISDTVAQAETTAERACLFELRAGCSAPVGVWARVDHGLLKLDGVVLSPDGTTRVQATTTAELAAAEAAGRRLAAELFAQNAGELIAKGFSTPRSAE